MHLIDELALTLEPSVGPIVGGTRILISGGMALGSSVNHVGCAVCGKQTAGILLSSTLISCVTPAMDGNRQCSVVLHSHVDDEIRVLPKFEYYETHIILSVVPLLGPTQGGTVLEIVGSHFQATMMCRFGHNVMAPFFISTSYIRCTSPPHDIQLVAFSIGMLDSGARDEQFTFGYYAQPVTFQLWPSTGPISGTTVVFLQGDLLVCHTGCTCRFGSHFVQAHQSGSEIACAISGMQTGMVTVDIALNGKDFTSVARPFHWRQAMICLRNVPSSGPASGGYVVTVTGSHFTNAYMKCSFGDLQQNAFFHSSSKVTCIAPAVSAGPKIRITVLDAQSLSVCQASSVSFQVDDHPKISWLSPSSGPIGGGNTVFVNGVDSRMSWACLFTINGAKTESVIMFKHSQIGCTVPHASQETEAILEILDDHHVVLHSFAYYFQMDPYVRTVVPTHIISGEHQHITIHGSHFRQSPDLKCKIDNTSHTASFMNSRLIVCHVAVHGTGSLSVEVSNNGVDFSQNGAFATFLRSPSSVFLTSIQPSQGPQSGQTSVIFSGRGWHHSSEVMCLLGGFHVIAKHNSSTISCKVPRLTDFIHGTRSLVHGLPATEIEVQVSIDGALIPERFVYAYLPTASIGAIIPAFGSTHGGTVLQIIGEQFASGPSLTCRFQVQTGPAFEVEVDAHPPIKVAGLFETSSLVTCATPAHTKGSVAVDISSNGADFTDDHVSFSFILPARIDTLLPRRGPSGQEL